MTAAHFADNCRQLAFITSLLAGFAFTFYGVLLATPLTHRFGSWTCFLAMAASLVFLLVTFGDTLAALAASALVPETPVPVSLTRRKFVLDICFLFAVVPLFVSFGLGGWLRSRQLGIATSVAAGVAIVSAFLILLPYLH